MPRTVSAPYLAIVNGVHFNLYALVQVERADGSWQELTNFLGMDWLEEIHWSENIDNPVGAGSIVLGREHKGADGVAISLAPGVQDSPANIVSAAYSPILGESRGIRAQIALTAPGVAPVAGDFIPMIVGKIDDVDAKGLDGKVTLNIRDIGAWLLDTQIQVKRTYGSGAPGTPIATVMRSIIGDNLQPKVNGGAAETLYVWGAPAFNIREYEQTNEDNVLAALRNLADLIGGDVRYRWQPDGVTFGLTFSVPDRAKVVEDWTLGPDDYFNVIALKQSDIGVRNVARVRYTDADTGLGLFQDATSAPSILAHGVRYMEVGEDTTSQIDTAAEALTMATAIVSDLKDPTSESEIETMFYPIVQLNDLGKFLANGRHYDRDRRLAVVQFKHDITREKHRTSIQHRGQVTGGYWKWLGKGGAGSGTGALPTFLETATTTEGGGVTTATLSVAVADPDNRIQLFQFAVGRTLGTLGAFVTAPGPSPYVASVNLLEGDTGFIAYRAVGLDLSGNISELTRRAVGVGAARTPHIDGVIATFPDATTTRLTARGDPLCAAWRMTVRTDRAPTAAEIRAASLVVGQNVTADYALTVSTGSPVYIGAYAYGHADGTGLESAQFAAVAIRDGSGAAEQPTAVITVTSETNSQVFVTLTGVVGRGSPGPLEYRTRLNIDSGGGTLGGTFSAWASASTFPLAMTINKNLKNNKILELETRQNGGSDGQFGRDVLSIAGLLVAVDPADGRIDRGQVYSTPSGGGYGGYATDITGYTAGSSNRDSRLQPINTLFAKSADTMDNIGDGGTFGKASFTRLGYSDRAGTALDASARFKRSNPFDDLGYGARATDVQGHALHVNVMDSNSRAIYDKFSISAHTLDVVSDGGTYRRSTLNEATGGGRGFATIDSGNRVRRANGFDDGNYAAAAFNAVGTTLATGVTDASAHPVTDSFFRSTHTADNMGDGASKRAITFGTLDASGILQTGVGAGASIGTVRTARDVSRQVGRYFSETWEVNTTSDWALVGGTANNFSSGYTDGATGSNVLVLNGPQFFDFTGRLPYNKSKLYRMRARIVLTDSAATRAWFIGVKCIAGNGTLLGHAWVAAYNYTPNDFNWHEFTGWMRGDTGVVADSTDAPNPLAPANLPTGTQFISPAFAVNWPSGTLAQCYFDYITIDELDEDAAYRTYTALGFDGNANPVFKQYDGTNVKSYARGGLSGQTQNNQTITFGTIQQFVSTPAVNLLGGAALTRVGAVWRVNDTGGTFVSAGAGDVYDDTHATNVTRQHFTCRARLRQKATTTPASASFPGGNSVTVVGNDTGYATLTGGVSSSDQYTVNWRLTHTVTYPKPFDTGTSVLVIAIDADPTGSGAWAECGTVNYNDTVDHTTTGGTFTYDDTQTVSVTGFTTSGRFRLRVKSQTNTQFTTATFTLHGYVAGTDAAAGVTYSTSVGDLYASRTPASDDFIDYTVVELAY